jgi:hypothetical protein
MAAVFVQTSSPSTSRSRSGRVGNNGGGARQGRRQRHRPVGEGTRVERHDRLRHGPVGVDRRRAVPSRRPPALSCCYSCLYHNGIASRPGPPVRRREPRTADAGRAWRSRPGGTRGVASPAAAGPR